MPKIIQKIQLPSEFYAQYSKPYSDSKDASYIPSRISTRRKQFSRDASCFQFSVRTWAQLVRRLTHKPSFCRNFDKSAMLMATVGVCGINL